MAAAIKNFFAKGRKDVDMTEGNIFRHLITFAIPLLIGNIFQQLYNMVDTWVVGNYVSDEAFSAVGTVGPIINLLIGFFMGFSSGAGILRAVGDSKRPFYFLVVSAVTNTVLDLVFVLVFHMGVGGVALATILAQGLSAVLILITLMRTDTCLYTVSGLVLQQRA